MILSNSGVFIAGNSADRVQSDSALQYYCREVNCVPPELQIWFK